MSFDVYESSRSKADPVNLYFFKYGQTPTSYYAYTDAEEPVTYLGVKYEPIPLDRGPINSSGSLDKSTMNVSMPHDASISEIFRVYPPGQVVTLIIRQGHISDSSEQYFVVWAGRVLSRTVEGFECTFHCEPIATSMERAGLRRNYQFGCPHTLYGTQCKANMAPATSVKTIQSLAADSITLLAAWAPNPQKYVGGMVKWARDGNTELRTIIRVTSGVNLKLSGVVRGLSVGDSIEVILGCNRQMDDCRDLHSNINNFGGQPWIPTKNPFAKQSLFS
jgi:hypothetical protein